MRLILVLSWIFVISAAQDSPFHYSLSENELRDIISESEFDSEEAEEYGQQIHSFFRESNSQLILDLDLFTQFWQEFEKARASAADGDTDYIKEIIAFFEPLKKYDISAPCLADIFHFLWTTYNYARTANEAKSCDDCNCTMEYKKIFGEYQWIFDVVDAVGKLPAAVTSGNNLWLGSWSTCRKISHIKNLQNQSWNGQYCLAKFYVHNKNNPLNQPAKDKKPDPTDVCRAEALSYEQWLPEDKKCFEEMPLLNVGLCVPDTCTDYDFKKIVEYFYKFAESSVNKKFVCDLKVQCSNDRAENKIYSNLPSMLALCFCLIILSLMIYGTFYDYYVAIPTKEKQEIFMRQVSYLSQGSNFLRYFPFEPEAPIKGAKQNKFVNLLMMFSMRRNMEQIMSTRTQDDQINCLHGARFLSMCWIIFGHTYYYICTSLTTDNLLQTLQKFPKIFYNQLVVQAPLAVDSFFFLSGLLTTYIFIKKLKSASAREKQTKVRASIRLGNPSVWIAYYFRRYIRLTPVYLVIMILDVTLFTYVSDGPFWRPIEKFCKESWWVNLLYLNNFIKQESPCMGWTWYMANDWQLHCFAPILIIALYKYKNKGISFAGFLLAASLTLKLAITIKRGYPPAPVLDSKLKIVRVLNSYWEDLYVKPYIRCVPYIVGSVVGYLLNTKHIVSGEFKLRGIKLWSIWTFAAALGIYSVFGLWHFSNTGDELLPGYHILYTVFGRFSFSLFLGWTIFACQTGHADKINRILGHKFFIPLSKMTFCAYLIHPILLQLYYLSRNTAFHFTHAFQMFYMFSVAVFCSYAVALILCLAFEQPVTNFDKLVFQEHGSHRRAPKREDNDIELHETQPSSPIEVPDKPIILGGDPPSALKRNH